MRLYRHASSNFCSPLRHQCTSSTCEKAPTPQAAPLPLESRHSSDAIDLRRRLAGALQSSVRPSQVRGHEGTKSDQDPASPHEGVCTVAQSTLLLEALMARSFAPSFRPPLRPLDHRPGDRQREPLASWLTRSPVANLGATTLIGARLPVLGSVRPDPGNRTLESDRFQSLQRIGADTSPTIRYRPRHRAMCSADKSKRAQKVREHLPGPLNARQEDLYDEPPEVYRPSRAQGAPLVDPAGLPCLRESCSERQHQANALGTAAPTSREQPLRLDSTQNPTRLSRRAHPLLSMAKGVTRAM